MKFTRSLAAFAVVFCSISVQSESQSVSGSLAVTPGAVARLNFRIIVPKVLYLRVGSGVDFANTPTVDEVLFTVPPGDASTPGTIVNGVGSAGAITARIYGNGGNVTLRNVGSGSGLVGGANTIPWSQILPNLIAGTLANPPINSSRTVAAVGRMVNESATWGFRYDNTPVAAEGDYRGQVTYTATML